MRRGLPRTLPQCTPLLALLLLLLVGRSQAASAAIRAVVTSIFPAQGSLGGGTRVTISGAGFMRRGVEGHTMVYIGNELCQVGDIQT